MSQFNYFGVTPNDIIESFVGSISADFATNSKSGFEIISNELERAEAEALELLSVREANLLTRIQGIQVVVSSGGIITYPAEFPPLPPLERDLRVYSKVKNEVINCDYESVWSYLDFNGSCDCCNGGSLSVETSGSLVYDKNRDYFASYYLDQSQINIVSLKNFIRDRTCWVLGANLYSRSGKENTWDLIRIFEERSKAFFDRAAKNKFVVQEFKKYRWIVSPLPTQGIIGIRMYRS